LDLLSSSITNDGPMDEQIADLVKGRFVP